MKTTTRNDPAVMYRPQERGSGIASRATSAKVAVLAMLCSLMGSSACFGATYERTYTLDEDFALGVLDGVNYTAVPDQLQLSTEATTFAYAWISNAGDGTISKIDTTLGVEVARYRTGPGGGAENPSRTAIDIDGNCWVANRGTGTVVKILAEGGTNTSTGPADVKPWNTDDRVAFSVLLGGASNCLPRAIAIDQSGRVWIGLYNQKRYAVLDGATGAILGYVPTSQPPYGAAIDKNGILWSAIATWGIEKIDTVTMQSLATFQLGKGYGIAVDNAGFVWLGGYTSGGVNRFDSATSTNQYLPTPGYSAGRGVCVAPNGNVWVALGYGTPDHNVAKFSSSGALLAVYDLAAFGYGALTPCGVATDFDGNIIVVCSASDDVYKLREETGALMWRVHVGNNPYTYSDFTGYVIRNLTQHTGTWSTVFDSGLAGMAWGRASWTASAEGEASVGVQVRAADTVAALPALPWLEVQNDQDFGTITGQFIEVRARLSTTNDTDLPVLYDLTIKAANHPPVAVALANDAEAIEVEQTSHAGTPVTLDGSMSSDLDNDLLTYEWDFDSDGTYDATGAVVVNTYNRGGPYTATLRVTDPAGLSSTDTVEITVVDTTPPVIENITLATTMLWPPNHQMVPIGITATVSDICDAAPVIRIIGVSSNEPVNDVGDGNTAPDWNISGDLELQLRAERAGPRNSRVYTITFECTDAAGNTSTATATVTVPRDMRPR